MKGGYPLHLKAMSEYFGATVCILSIFQNGSKNTRSCPRSPFKLGLSWFKYLKYYYLNTESIVIY